MGPWLKVLIINWIWVAAISRLDILIGDVSYKRAVAYGVWFMVYCQCYCKPLFYFVLDIYILKKVTNNKKQKAPAINRGFSGCTQTTKQKGD